MKRSIIIQEGKLLTGHVQSGLPATCLQAGNGGRLVYMQGEIKSSAPCKVGAREGSKGSMQVHTGARRQVLQAKSPQSSFPVPKQASIQSSAA